MSFFSWMRGTRQWSGEPAIPAQHRTTAVASLAGEVKHELTYLRMEPSAIADEVIYLSSEHARASELCEEANVVLKGHEYGLGRLRERNTYLEYSNKNLQADNKNLNFGITQWTSSANQKSAQLLEAQQILRMERERYKALEQMLRLEQKRCQALHDEVLEARMTVRTAKYGDLYDGKISIFYRLSRVLLKSSPANHIPRPHCADHYASSNAISMLTQHADLRPVPFVVVLVDGDSYSFLDQSKASGPAGPEIAHNLHREVSKYILSHPQIPPHSKIIVRVFCNRSSLQGRLVNASKTKRGSRPTLVEEKMVKLAETYPLFDYLNCGGGKERVDDKIRENTHLFLADSNCHGLFLGICNDNGYVRMLERYNNNPIPAAKIVLLTNGSITPEMASLCFPKVQLNAVFHDVYAKKLKQGTSQKMGMVLDASKVQGFQNASDYDLNYTKPSVRNRTNNTLDQMRQEKQKKASKPAIFARLPYESNERYEERMRELLPLSCPCLAYRRRYSHFVGHIGLRKNRPNGVLPTAPILPFLLYWEAVQSTHAQVSENTENSWMMGEVLDEMSWVLD